MTAMVLFNGCDHLQLASLSNHTVSPTIEHFKLPLGLVTFTAAVLAFWSDELPFWVWAHCGPLVSWFRFALHILLILGLLSWLSLVIRLSCRFGLTQQFHLRTSKSVAPVLSALSTCSEQHINEENLDRQKTQKLMCTPLGCGYLLVSYFELVTLTHTHTILWICRSALSIQGTLAQQQTPLDIPGDFEHTAWRISEIYWRMC